MYIAWQLVAGSQHPVQTAAVPYQRQALGHGTLIWAPPAADWLGASQVGMLCGGAEVNFLSMTSLF